MAKTLEGKLSIGTVTLPGRPAIKLDKDFKFEYSKCETIDEVKADKDFNDKWVLDSWNETLKANARAAEYQRQLKVLADENPLTDEMKAALEFELGVKAFMKATGKNEETARQILMASKE